MKPNLTKFYLYLFLSLPALSMDTTTPLDASTKKATLSERFDEIVCPPEKKPRLSSVVSCETTRRKTTLLSLSQDNFYDIIRYFRADEFFNFLQSSKELNSMVLDLNFEFYKSSTSYLYDLFLRMNIDQQRKIFQCIIKKKIANKNAFFIFDNDFPLCHEISEEFEIRSLAEHFSKKYKPEILYLLGHYYMAYIAENEAVNEAANKKNLAQIEFISDFVSKNKCYSLADLAETSLHLDVTKDLYCTLSELEDHYNLIDNYFENHQERTLIVYANTMSSDTLSETLKFAAEKEGLESFSPTNDTLFWKSRIPNIKKIAFVGNHIRNIDNYFFTNCHSIEEIDLSGLTSLKSIGKRFCSHYFSTDRRKSNIKSIIFSQSCKIESIGKLFAAGTLIEHFDWTPFRYLKKIPTGAFEYGKLSRFSCEALPNLESIEQWAFYHSDIKEINLSNALNLKSMPINSNEKGGFVLDIRGKTEFTFRNYQDVYDEPPEDVDIIASEYSISEVSLLGFLRFSLDFSCPKTIQFEEDDIYKKVFDKLIESAPTSTIADHMAQNYVKHRDKAKNSSTDLNTLIEDVRLQYATISDILPNNTKLRKYLVVTLDDLERHKFTLNNYFKTNTDAILLIDANSALGNTLSINFAMLPDSCKTVTILGSQIHRSKCYNHPPDCTIDLTYLRSLREFEENSGILCDEKRLIANIINNIGEEKNRGNQTLKILINQIEQSDNSDDG